MNAQMRCYWTPRYEFQPHYTVPNFHQWLHTHGKTMEIRYLFPHGFKLEHEVEFQGLTSYNGEEMCEVLLSLRLLDRNFTGKRKDWKKQCKHLYFIILFLSCESVLQLLPPSQVFANHYARNPAAKSSTILKQNKHKMKLALKSVAAGNSR